MKKIYTDKFRSSYKCECGVLIERVDQIQFGEEDDMEVKFPRSYIDLNLKEFVAEDLFSDRIYRKKRCVKCKGVLPSKVGVVPTFKIAFLGMKGSGKTVYSLALEQVMKGMNQSHFAKQENISLHIIMNDTVRYRQRETMMNNFNIGVLPEPTRNLNREFHIPFEIHNESTKTDAILLLYDLPGEITNHTINRASNVSEADVLFYMIDGSKLNETDLLYNKECFRNILCSLKKRIPVYLIVTKIDLFTGYSVDRIRYGNNVLENSLENGKTNAMINVIGYDETLVEANGKYAKYLLDHTGTDLYQDLESIMPKEMIYFFAVSAYSPTGGCFGVDLPLMHFLAQKSLIPYKEE